MSNQPADPTPETAGTEVDPWAAQVRIGRQLGIWSGLSIAGGSALALAGHARGNQALRAFGVQNAGWGAIDLAIAGLGELRRRRRLATITDPGDGELQGGERRSLRRVLLVNAGLDVGYVALGVGGLGWSLSKGTRPLPALAGHAAAVVVQGGFLLVFDTLHARGLGGSAS